MRAWYILTPPIRRGRFRRFSFRPPQATDWSVDQCKGLGDELRTSAEKHLGLVKKALDKIESHKRMLSPMFILILS